MRWLFVTWVAVLGLAVGAEPDLAQLIASAKAGNNEAMYAVFLSIVQKGSEEHPISKDQEEVARYWLIKAGESENFRAARVLALCYEKGCFGVPVDLERARHYREIAKEPAP